MMIMQQHISIKVSKARQRSLRKIGCMFFLAIAVLELVACYYPGPQSVVVRPLPDSGVTIMRAPMTPVNFYPKTGQTPDHQDRDRYECYNWAVSQTGFDPYKTSLLMEQRVTVVPVPAPGYDTAVLGVGGAVLGALIGGPRNALGGALIGGATGAIVGAASDAARQESAWQTEAAYNARGTQAHEVQYTGKAQEFRRAMSACLEGRGYIVK
jgi:hypothetical protein